MNKLMNKQNVFVLKSGISPKVTEEKNNFFSIFYNDLTSEEAMDVIKYYFADILTFKIDKSKAVFSKKATKGFILNAKIDVSKNTKTQNTLAFTISKDNQLFNVRIKLLEPIISFFIKKSLLGETILEEWLSATKIQKRVNNFKTEGNELILFDKNITFVEKLLAHK